VQAVCIAPGAVAVKLFLPFHHVCLAAVFLDEPADVVTALVSASSAFDAEHVEFSFDVTEDEIGSPRHNGDITTCKRDRRCLMAKKPTEGRRKLVEFDAPTWHGLNLLSRESMKSFQDLADEGIPGSVAQAWAADCQGYQTRIDLVIGAS
jgi:hypothetical protein